MPRQKVKKHTPYRYTGDPREDWADVCDRAKERVLSDHLEFRGEAVMEEAESLIALARKISGKACPVCAGFGWRWYPSTAIWRGGMGGSAMSVGVCDECWGTGRSDVRGADLRALEAEIAAARADSSARWLMARIGAGTSTQRPRLVEVAKKLRRARWSDFWVARVAEAVAAALEEMAGQEDEVTR